MRITNNAVRDNMIKSANMDRKVLMNKEKHQLKHVQHDAKKDLMFSVQQALNKLITKRRQEFEA